MKFLSLIAASCAVLVLGGCASSAGIASRATMIVPESIGLQSEFDAHEAGTWWRNFDDPVLTALVERALAGNPTMRGAQARLERASASVAGSRAAAGLHVNGTADVTRERLSATSIYPPPLGGATVTFGNAQLAGSWEVDFFGRNRAAIESALGAERAAQAEIRAARMLLATSVARDYFQLARLLGQREVASRTLEQRTQTLGIIRQRVASGLDTNVELRQGEGALPDTRQQIELLDEQIALERHALAALTVQPSDALDTLVPPLGAARAIAPPAIVPADLLGRRSDVAVARARVEAATSDVTAAKAEFYPNVNLMAFAGFSSIGLDQLFKSDSRQYGAGPAVRLPIFDAGRLRANLRGKAADLDAAIESYNGVVIEAVHDAADQITSLRSIERQQVQQGEAQAAAESAYDLALQRYRAGITNYLTVLNAETTVLNQRRQATDLKARALDTQVALIHALGGAYAAGESK
jgi:NodT family efflux transporter outer membrane factor (OMF) lipoprotein